ncbi:hypothetical protein V5799_033469 [Amblyomma americanum]|uniref:Uncharacterized protein n=1 Tax=Amblyomma americanum TaxID=6943 RepID=A0AAQ4DN86_AMBAM
MSYFEELVKKPNTSNPRNLTATLRCYERCCWRYGSSRLNKSFCFSVFLSSVVVDNVKHSCAAMGALFR